jgi:hypothetical protein
MKYFYIFLSLVALVTPISSAANERFFLQVPVKTDPSAPITAKVRSECALEMLLENYALSGMGQRGLAVESVAAPEQAGANKIIELTILSAYGFGGGSWSGPKSMSVRVDVKKEGAVLSSTVLTRASRGGVFGGMIGTCAILDRVASVLGKDLALWLTRGSVPHSKEANSSVTSSTDEAESSSAK